MSEVIDLSRQLIGSDTINPPGNEARCMDLLERRLQHADFDIRRIDLEPGRPNLIARFGGDGEAIAFTGHLDVVPLGEAEWSVEPFGGEVRDGRLYGRGSTDMKGAVAAIVLAAEQVAAEGGQGRPVELVLTSSEETNLEGAALVRRSGLLGDAGLLIIGEPTSNRPAFGHRGVLWLELAFLGKTAHGSRPELGHNAVLDAARAATMLAPWPIDGADHPVMGRSTINVSGLQGGLNVNSVPDLAKIQLDFRLLPAVDSDWVEEQVHEISGCHAIEVLSACEGWWSDPEQALLRRVRQHVGIMDVEAAPYGTDGSHLVPAYGNIPAMILGPGEMAQAHQTDEWIEVERLENSVEIYAGLMRAWRRGAL